MPILLSEIRLKTDISFTPSENGLVVGHPDGERYFRFSNTEYLLATLIHSHRDSEALSGDYTRRTGKQLTEAELEHFIEILRDFDLLERPTIEAPTTPSKQNLARLARIQLPLHRPDAILDRLKPVSTMLFAREFVALALIMLLIALTYTFGHFEEFNKVLATKELTPPVKIALTWVAGLLLGIAHEYGHGLACNYYGGKVPRMGVMLYWLFPMFYCDTSSAYRLKRQERLVVTLSGLYLQGFLASLALLMLLLMPLSEGGRYLLVQMVVLSFLLSWVNLFPLVKLDGYYLLGDLLGIDNLRPKALSAMFKWVKAPRRPEKSEVFLVAFGLLGSIASIGMAIAALYWGIRLVFDIFGG